MSEPLSQVAGPFDLGITWKQDATPEELKKAEEWVTSNMAELKATDIPAAIASLTIKRV